MTEPRPDSDAWLVAQAVHQACLMAAMDAYEQAGWGGLCEEGRQELVVDAIRSLDLDEIVAGVLGCARQR